MFLNTHTNKRLPGVGEADGQEGSARFWILIGLSVGVIIVAAVLLMVLGAGKKDKTAQEDPSEDVKGPNEPQGGREPPNVGGSRINVVKSGPGPLHMSAERKRQLVANMKKGAMTEEERDRYTGPPIDVTVEGPGPDGMHLEVYSTLTQMHDQLAGCYKKGLSKNPGLKGKVSFNLAFQIKDKRSHVMATIDNTSTLRDSKVEACMTRRLNSINMDMTFGDLKEAIPYPVTFKPGKAAAAASGTKQEGEAAPSAAGKEGERAPGEGQEEGEGSEEDHPRPGEPPHPEGEEPPHPDDPPDEGEEPPHPDELPDEDEDRQPHPDEPPHLGGEHPDDE